MSYVVLAKNYDIRVISLISPGLGQSQAKPGQLFGFWPGLGFYKAEPPKARPKPGLSGQAGADTSLAQNAVWSDGSWPITVR